MDLGGVGITQKCHFPYIVSRPLTLLQDYQQDLALLIDFGHLAEVVLSGFSTINLLIFPRFHVGLFGKKSQCTAHT